MRFFNKRQLFFLALFIVLILPAVLPLIHEGFFVTDDGEWMIIRLSAFYQTLRDGQIPVRFIDRLNFGYGYPVATFLYPGIMYFGSIIHILNIGFVTSIKIIIGLSMVGSFVFTYFWLRKFFDKTAAFLGGLTYLYLPYHLFDTYVRGSVGEVFALLWVPFILWNIERENLFFVSVGIALLILSHNSLALLFAPVIFTYILLKILKNPQIKKRLTGVYICAGLLGVGLSAFFIVPVLFELSLTQFSKTTVSNPFEYFADIKLIGWVSIFVLVCSAFVLVKNKTSRKDFNLLLFTAVTAFSIFLSSIYSSSLWKVIPANFIQFPFRFLSLSLISTAFLSAFVASKSKGIYKAIFILFVTILLVVSSYQYLSTIKYFDKGEGFYTTNDATTTVKDEYMPVWVKSKPSSRPARKIEIVKGEGTVKNLDASSNGISFDTNFTSAATIQINTVYWPGWEALIDGKTTKISYNNSGGLIRLDIPEGSHHVSLNFGETPLRLVSDVISAISLVLLIIFAAKTKNLKKPKNENI